mmetsp:Transcript_48155/g.114475  ORF Transcript_48155/g.114475 Transcript_48155/m.114475 type:complete len:238 (+) Transcript_48155:154-867(+)
MPDHRLRIRCTVLCLLLFSALFLHDLIFIDVVLVWTQPTLVVGEQQTLRMQIICKGQRQCCLLTLNVVNGQMLPTRLEVVAVLQHCRCATHQSKEIASHLWFGHDHSHLILILDHLLCENPAGISHQCRFKRSHVRDVQRLIESRAPLVNEHKVNHRMLPHSLHELNAHVDWRTIQEKYPRFQLALLIVHEVLDLCNHLKQCVHRSPVCLRICASLVTMPRAHRNHLRRLASHDNLL